MPNKKLSPFVSAVFSILSNGLGQIYNGQLKKGLYFFLATYLFYISTIFVFKMPSTFTGAVILVVIALLWNLYLIFDSVAIAIKRKEREIKSYNRWYIYLILIIINYFVFDSLSAISKENFFRSAWIPTTSMEPAIRVNDYIVSDMSVGYTGLKQGDLVIYKDPQGTGEPYVKRCVALGGQTVRFTDSEIWVDGVKLKNRKAGRQYNSPAGSVSLSDSTIVPEGYCFVLGDNYSNSFDSRHHGCIPMSLIAGKPLYIYWAEDKSRIGMNVF